MRYTIKSAIFLIGLFQSFSCTDFIAGLDLNRDWLVLKSDSIILHYREPDFSDKPSPSEEEARFILENQQFYYSAIQDSINRRFNDKVMIYLFNQDEAKTRIGKEFGGHAIPKFNTFYYSFFHSDRTFTDQYGIGDPFLGAHELVHVITHQTLGYAGSKVMSEGYANWLDGSYAKYQIQDIIRSYRNNEPEKILTPDELLLNTGIADEIYYPNSGVFTAFLVRTCGIEKVNRLFTSIPSSFKKHFEQICSDSWQNMSEKYSDYVDSL